MVRLERKAGYKRIFFFFFNDRHCYSPLDFSARFFFLKEKNKLFKIIVQIRLTFVSFFFLKWLQGREPGQMAALLPFLGQRSACAARMCGCAGGDISVCLASRRGTFSTVH